MLLRIIPFFYFLFFANVLIAQYKVKGQVNINENWQPKIYMAAVNKISDYYRTSPDMIIKSAVIDNNGKFEIKGDNLPNEKRFYRLYVMKKQNSDYDACLYVGGDDHNFVHILLENGEEVEINAAPNATAPFEKYQVVGQKENHLMRTLSNIVYPRFYFHRIEFPTELKFSEDKLHIDLKNFADTCSSTLVSLAAITNTDFDEYYDQNPAFYQNFKTRLKSDLPKSIYTKNYNLKVKYYANEETLLPNWTKFLLAFLSLSLFGLLVKLNQFKNRIQTLENQNILPIKIETPSPSIDELLTQKEKEILLLISQGKSNKEIASSLFVELSTVKTHINKIYSKIGASNRKEAQTLAKRAFREGV